MLAIDLHYDDKNIGEALQAEHGDLITVIEGRGIDGTIEHWTLFLSAAALAVPAIRKVAIELIQSKRHRTLTFKGIKIQGYSADEVNEILAEVRKLADKV